MLRVFCTNLMGSNQNSFALYAGNNPLKDHRKCLPALNFIRHLAANSVSIKLQLWIIIFERFRKKSYPNCASAWLHRTTCKSNASSLNIAISLLACDFHECGLLEPGGAFHRRLVSAAAQPRHKPQGMGSWDGRRSLLSHILHSRWQSGALRRADTAIQVSRLQGK